jgi:outer membrane protein OmpA-like peptidoglycan-associated protein
MKKIIKISLLSLFFLGIGFNGEAQILKKIKKRAEEAAKETILRKVEEKSAEETEKAMDSILEAPGKKVKKRKGKKGAPNPDEEELYEPDTEESVGEFGETDPAVIRVYSKFDFVPGDSVVFYDDFSKDYIGDFPSKWNTNGGGEIVSTDDGTQKWYEMKPGYSIYHIPDVTDLPEDYTVEFDLMATGLDQKTASTTTMKIILSDNTGFDLGNYAYAQLSFCQYSPVGLWVRNSTKDINNKVEADIREAVLYRPHISLAVNQQRLRLWVNENKVVDIPRLIPVDNRPNSLKFELLNFKDGKERLFISNLKVAEGGVDLRRKLIEEGSVSTNGILFESGSASLQPQSMGIIRQISQVLQQEPEMNLVIIGHTDADGDDALNMALSAKRAETVVNALVQVYQIDPDRLQAEGKGETDPVADNSTTNGKAQNRRVEFIKV